MAMKKHTRLDLVEGGNIFKQGDYVTLGFIPRDYTGASVDLTNKQIEGSIFNGSTGVIYEGPASFVDGKIFFTIKQVLNDGKFQLEFTVTDAADPEYRTKFPTDDYASELTIKPSADNLDYVGVSMATVAQLRTEQEQKQQQFELAIVPQVDELKQRVEEGIGAFTEDTEVKDARMDEINLRTFNQKVVAQLAEKALIEDTAKLTNGMRLGSRIALMSDSIGQAPFYLGNSGGNNPATRMRGETWINTASIASKGLIRVGINAAISGNTTQQMLDRFDADLGGTNAEKWDTLAVCGGVNDGIYTVKQTAANIEQMAKKALLLGKNVVFCTLFPANTHAQRVRIRKINFLVQQLAAKYHAPLVDFHAHFLNPATGSWKVGFNADSLHPNLAGVNEAGKFFATTVTPFMQSAQPFLALDNLDTRVMVTGTTNPNPLWLTDTDANGVPDGYTRSANPGGYGFEFGMNPAFDADAVRCKITAVEAATGPFNVAASFDTTKWTSLEICQVALKVKFTPGVAGATAPKFLMKVEAPGSTEGFAFQQELRAAHDGVIVSEPFTVPVGTTNLAHKMEVVGGAMEVEFSRPTLINLTRQGMV